MRLGFFLLLTTLVYFSCSKEIIQHKLSVEVSPLNGGLVSPPSNSYEKGQSLQMLATPASEYLFKEWKGDLTGKSNPTTLVLDKDKQVTASFEKRQYPLNLTIEGSGTIKEEIIALATQSQYPSGTTVRLTPQPLEGWAFSGWSGDLSGTSNPLNVKIDKAINLKATFNKLIITSIKIENPIDTLVISKNHKFIVKGIYSNGTSSDISNLIQLSFENKLINSVSGNSVVGVKSGNEIISLKYADKIYKTPVFVSNLEEVKEIDPFLKSPSSNAKIRIPVIIINYIPTSDGINLDNSKAPGVFRLPNKSIEEVKKALNNLGKGIKFSAEEGSKFRGYKNNSITPFVGIEVVKQFNLYEIPLIKAFFKSDASYLSDPMHEPDYFKIFNLINLKYLVENLGVKEVWFNVSHMHKGLSSYNPNIHKQENFVVLAESNMSSPSGDISNSFRHNNDLPVYRNTYVVYGFNYNGAFDLIDFIPNNIHARSHQIEIQLSHLDRSPQKELFNNKFVGIPLTGGKPIGRCGNVHFPPNALNDYDYNNLTQVESDIEDWKPDASGTFKKINKNIWNNYNYSWPKDVFVDSQSNWLVYWYQSIPNMNSNLSYNGKILRNWWELFYNWDDAIKNKKTLWIE